MGCSLAQRLSSLQPPGDSQTAGKQHTAETASAAPQPCRQHHVGSPSLAKDAHPSQHAAVAEDQIQLAHAKELSTEALLAALLFAAHPVHTEAVAGIVGHAELLCATLFAAALLAYMRAIDATSAEGSPAQWQLVAAALALVLLAAFAKEIGITAVSSYHGLCFVACCQACSRSVAQAHLASNSGSQWIVQVVPMALYDVMVSSAGTAHTRGYVRVSPQLAVRCAALVTVAAAYVGIRQTVTGGEQLVSIYRKVGFLLKSVCICQSSCMPCCSDMETCKSVAFQVFAPMTGGEPNTICQQPPDTGPQHRPSACLLLWPTAGAMAAERRLVIQLRAAGDVSLGPAQCSHRGTLLASGLHGLCCRAAVACFLYSTSRNCTGGQRRQQHCRQRRARWQY